MFYLERGRRPIIGWNDSNRNWWSVFSLCLYEFPHTIRHCSGYEFWFQKHTHAHMYACIHTYTSVFTLLGEECECKWVSLTVYIAALDLPHKWRVKTSNHVRFDFHAFQWQKTTHDRFGVHFFCSQQANKLKRLHANWPKANDSYVPHIRTCVKVKDMHLDFFSWRISVTSFEESRRPPSVPSWNFKMRERFLRFTSYKIESNAEYTHSCTFITLSTTKGANPQLSRHSKATLEQQQLTILPLKWMCDLFIFFAS